MDPALVTVAREATRRKGQFCLVRTFLALPIYPFMTKEAKKYVYDALKNRLTDHEILEKFEHKFGTYYVSMLDTTLFVQDARKWKEWNDHGLSQIDSLWEKRGDRPLSVMIKDIEDELEQQEYRVPLQEKVVAQRLRFVLRSEWERLENEEAGARGGSGT